MKYILYLHGFHSSPNSEKALIFKQQIKDNFTDIDVIAPQIPVLPQLAIDVVKQLLLDFEDRLIGIVGSSLGGYLATHLHNISELPAAVINPAVKPFELLADYLGEQTHPITGEDYFLADEHMTQLKSVYDPKVRNPKRIWLLQQEKDEVLDYQQALNHYQSCKVTFEKGGSHAFDDFHRFPVEITQFLLAANNK